MSRYTPPKNRDDNSALGQYWHRQFHILQAENDALCEAYSSLLKLAIGLAGDDPEILKALRQSLEGLSNED